MLDLLRWARRAIATFAVGALLIAAANTCTTRVWKPVTAGDFKRVIHATADRKQIVDQTSGAATTPQPQPPALPAVTEHLPPAVPRKDDDDDFDWT
jgi:hypothetical protein